MIHVRFKQVRKFLKLSQTAFGQRINKSLRTIQSYEDGSRSVTDGVLFQLGKEFNVNPSWLRTGIGEMFSKQKYDNSSPVIRPVVTAGDRAVCVRYFPEVKVSAGAGAFVNDETAEDFCLDKGIVRNPVFDVIITVLGDSMLPTLQNKDRILINTNVSHLSKLKKGQIYVLRQGDVIIIKRYLRRSGSICTFQSDNKEYGYIKIDLSDERNQIVGIPRSIIYRELPEVGDEESVKD